jgi:hypothetical protein
MTAILPADKGHCIYYSGFASTLPREFEKHTSKIFPCRNIQPAIADIK